MRRGIIFVLAAVVLAALVALPAMVSGYIVYIANLLLIDVVLCLGLNIIVGEAGQFALSHAAFYGIGIYVAGLAGNRLGWMFPLPMLCGGLLAAACGALIGAVALRMRDIYLALATFAFGQAMQWVFLNWSSVTGGPNGLHIAPARVGPVRIMTDAAAYPLVLGSAAVMLLLAVVLSRARFGRSLRALRGSEIAAAAMGIPVRRTKVIAFALSAAFAGIAGGMFATFSTFIHPDSLGFETTIAILTMIVVGGLGSIPGAVGGAALFGIAAELLRSLPAWREIIYGIILLGFMMFLPRGLVPALLARLRPAGLPARRAARA